jgi:hypothetical protein
MEKTNIYDFLHFLSLIKIKPNMDFGGKLALVDIWHKTHSFYVKEVEIVRFDRPNKHVRNTPWFPFICLFHLIRALKYGLITNYNFWTSINDHIIIIFDIHVGILKSIV